MANEKVTQLDELVSPILTDGLYIIDDFSGVPDSMYITVGNLLNSGLITVLGTVASGNIDALLVAASATVAGIQENATSGEATTGEATTRTLTPEAHAQSQWGERTLTCLVNGSAPLASSDGAAYFTRIPARFNGWEITEVIGNIVAGTGLVTIDLYNFTQSADILTTKLTIDANEKDSTDAVAPVDIDENEDDLTTGDRIRVDIDGEGTGTTWLEISLTIKKPAA
ncbi:MAG: hypothetical protein JRD89_14520 [Deltaproteobacteria bacterium]|nr:hypothetical protein [Deltaproteobacteria bacterium]